MMSSVIKIYKVPFEPKTIEALQGICKDEKEHEAHELIQQAVLECVECRDVLLRYKEYNPFEPNTILKHLVETHPDVKKYLSPEELDKRFREEWKLEQKKESKKPRKGAKKKK